MWEYENVHFLLFPTMFFILSKKEINIFGTFKLSSADIFNLVWSQNLSFWKGSFTLQQTRKPDDWFKLKAFAEEIININEKLNFNFGRIENIVREGENAGNPQCFQKPSDSGLLNVGNVLKRVNASLECIMPHNTPPYRGFIKSLSNNRMNHGVQLSFTMQKI